MTDNALFDQAILFAVKHHAGAVRKTSALPYIVHPLETMQILYSMGADIPLLTAAVLHDTVEDTHATLNDIYLKFGNHIGALVEAHTEDKRLTWMERKQHTIQTLPQASMEVKMMILADKVSNLRSIAKDYKRLGEVFWDSFNAPKEKQKWYYSQVYQALHELKDTPQTAEIYGEMERLYNEIFESSLT